MLGKLLKHEFRASSHVMLPIYLILLATAIGAKQQKVKLHRCHPYDCLFNRCVWHMFCFFHRYASTIL